MWVAQKCRKRAVDSPRAGCGAEGSWTIDASILNGLALAPNLRQFQIEGDCTMRIVASLAVLVFVSAPAYAQGSKPCEVLKSEIATKLEAKGVKAYTLEIVAKDKNAEGKVVGSCENGTKKILYRKTATPQATRAPASGKH
jgi:hypothetical protein